MYGSIRYSQSLFLLVHSLAGAVLSIVLVGGTVSAGNIYSYVDENGVTHFTNVPSDTRYSRLYHESDDRVYIHTSRRQQEQPRYNHHSAHSTNSEEISSLVSEAAMEHRLDPALIKAIIEVESGGRPNARSPKGAVGLMQLMPQTATEMGVRDRSDSRENIRGGTGYFKSLLKKFNGDIVLALAAYNAGPASVEKYNGIPPYLETVRYVRKVLEAWNRYRQELRHTN